MLAVAKVIMAKGNPEVCGNQKDNVYSLRKYAPTDNRQGFVQLSFYEDADEGKFMSIIAYGKSKLLFGQKTLGTKKVFLPYPHSMYDKYKSDDGFLTEVGIAIKAMYNLLP